jgi:hypothetical protein
MILDCSLAVTKMNSSIPASRASSTAYWISGLSTTGNISLGMDLVAGKKRVPRPPTGKIALRTGTGMQTPGGSWTRNAVVGTSSPDRVMPYLGVEANPTVVTALGWKLAVA